MTPPSPSKVARQHIQHGLARRDSRMYYMHHRNSIKLRAKRRYRRVHNTGAFHRQQRHRRLHPSQHHRIHASVAPSIGFWSPVWGRGTITGIDRHEICFRLDSDPEECVEFYENFLDSVVFDCEEDIDWVFATLDRSMGVDESE